MDLVKIGLGWVPLDKEGNPHRHTTGKEDRQSRRTLSLFPTETEAKNNSPVKKAKPVFYEEKVLDK